MTTNTPIGGDANIFLSNGGSYVAPPTLFDAMRIVSNSIMVRKLNLGKNFSEPECLQGLKVGEGK